jgi:nucleoid-associated protein YgaU
MPRSVVRGGVCALCAVAVLVTATGRVAAQVSIPNIQNPINKAKAAAGKTSDQINATNSVGNEKGASNAPGAAAAAQMADQQKKAATGQQKVVTTPATQKGAPAPGKAGAKAPAKGDSVSAVQLGGSRRSQVTIYREAFTYNSGGLRDPFVSLMLSGELRPIITDLVLTGVIYDPDGKRSVALLVDASTGESYRVRAGQTLARMKVTKIGMQDITFSIDEFGLSRSETLIIDKTRKGPIAAPRRP